MAGQNSAHDRQWDGPTGRANRLDRKWNRHLKPTVTAAQIAALVKGDAEGFLGLDRLKRWAERHRAG